MKEKNRIIVAVIALAAALVLGIGGWLFVKHEQRQSSHVLAFAEQVSLLAEQVGSLEEIAKSQSEQIRVLEKDNENLRLELRNIREKVVWSRDDYNYLAVGNSITRHGLASYWWNSGGMAVSRTELDYVHLTAAFLQEKKGTVHVEATGFSVWEEQEHDRDETLPLLDKFLDPNLDLITIQLGENIRSLETFERDLESLIGYIRERAPKARLLVIGDFWSMGERDEIKRRAALQAGAEYVSLDGIKDNGTCFAGMGTVVYGDDGDAHVIDHEGVAQHPGDKGMRAIADRVIDAIGNE